MHLRNYIVCQVLDDALFCGGCGQWFFCCEIGYAIAIALMGDAIATRRLSSNFAEHKIWDRHKTKIADGDYRHFSP